MNNDLNIADFDLSGLDIQLDASEPAWDRLLDQIIAGNVIPVLGSDILVDGADLHHLLVEKLAVRFGVKGHPHTFSELVYDHDYLRAVRDDRDQIYAFLNQVFAQCRFPASSMLKRLLAIRQFPFVITTSYTNLVENQMREVWGDDLRVMQFSNDPSRNDDLTCEADLRRPTVYYLFGRVGGHAHSYALTDTDMLDFCSSWLSDSNLRPRMLAGLLKNKYLLMLGNNYSDWLFRFIWYAIRRGCSSGERDLCSTSAMDSDLTAFLERNHTFLHDNPERVIEEIEQRLQKRLQQKEVSKFDEVEQHPDIFISYSRSDSQLAEQLYEELSRRGKLVWYDRNDITNGGYFIEEIKRGIRQARYFLPILSHHIEEECDQSHVYRIEWEEAITTDISLGRTYIIPLAEQGFDFYRASIPERIQQHNAIFYNPNEDVSQLADRILRSMNH